MKGMQWLAQASATFTGGAVALGLLAIPTYLWLPREFDALEERLDKQEARMGQILTAVTEARDASLTTTDAATRTVESQEALVRELARARAVPIGAYDHIAWSRKLNAMTSVVEHSSPPSKEVFLSFFPADVSKSITDRDLTSRFLYSDFVSAEWIFIEQTDFNELTSKEQDIVRAALVENGYLFVDEIR